MWSSKCMPIKQTKKPNECILEFNLVENFIKLSSMEVFKFEINNKYT